MINTGTTSYSPTLYYLVFRYAILEFDPDLIMINLGLNDIYNDWNYAHTLIVDDNGDPWAVPPRNI